MRNFIKSYKYILFCFFVPLAFGLLFFLLGNFYPFGYTALCPYDSIHQYISFLEEYRYKLINHESLFFSFRAASSNFYLIWLYYLTSPFNLLVLLFSDSTIAIEVITLLKLSFIGLSFGLYLYKTYKKNDLSVFLFSMCYLFSSYIMAYYYNIMWLDTVMLFPWVLYYLKKLIKGENNYAYSIILFFTIYCNFYMAISLCIFLCIYFLMSDFSNFKDFIVKFLKFSFFSILGGLSASVFFLPFLSIGLEKTSNIPKPYFLTDFASLFSSFSAFDEKHVSMSYSSNANIYCSIFCLLLFILYVSDKKIDLKNKIKNLFLVTFLFVSLNISTLDFILHGFAKPTGYNGRYSYILIFFIITCAYEEFLNIRQIRNDRLLKSSFVLITMFLASLIYLAFKDKADDKTIIPISMSVLLILIYSYLRILHNIKYKKEIFLFILGIELIGTSIWGFKTTDVENAVSAKEIYSELNNYDGDYRQHIDVRSISNETILNNMKSMSLFSSTITKPFTDFNYKLGLRGGSNYITCFGHSPVVDILYNIQYVYNKEDAKYFNFDKLDRKDGYAVYKNKYETSYAYIVPKTVMNWDWNNNNPFSNLNNFVGYYFNEHSSNTYIYDLVSSDEITLDSNFDEIKEKESNNYGVFFRKGKGNSGKIDFIYKAESDSVSVNVKAGSLSNLTIFVNDEERFSDSKVSGDIINIFDLQKGDIVKVEVKVKSESTSGDIYCNFAVFNETNYEKFANDICSNRIDVTTTSRSISGKLPEDDDSIVLFSIPYDKGWNLTINGEEKHIFDNICLMTASLEEGDFYLSYTPPLFKEGLRISLLSGLILLSFIIFEKRKKRSL